MAARRALLLALAAALVACAAGEGCRLATGWAAQRMLWHPVAGSLPPLDAPCGLVQPLLPPP